MRAITRSASLLLLGSIAGAGSPAWAQITDNPLARDNPAPPAEIKDPAAIAPLVPPVAAPPLPPLPTVSGTALFNAVAIEANTEAAAITRRDWQPERNEAIGLQLTQTKVLDRAWIEQQFAYNSMIGRPVALDRLVALVQQINRAFIANGYINSGVLIVGEPPADGSTLRLRLVLGRASSGENTGGVIISFRDGHPRGLSERFVRNRLPAAGEVPLNAIEVERQFRQLTENPAIRTVDADLQPGTRPGEAQLTLIVEPAPRFDFYASAANNRSPTIGGERYAIGGSLRNLLTGGDILAVEGGLTGRRGDVFASYDAPLFDPATTLLVRGGYNEASVIDAQLRPLGISATDWYVEGGVARTLAQRPLLPNGAGRWSSARAITVGLRFAHRNSKTYLFGEPFSFSSGSVNGRAEYSALRLTADWVERSVNMALAISLTATQGLGGTNSDIPGLLSPDGDFRSFRAQASVARRLTPKGLELRARLGGQWADGVLYSGERFSAGGAQTVRGYRETLLLADTGLIGSLELAQPFRLAKDRRRFDWSALVLSAFVDGAVVHNRRGPQSIPNEIASLGASLAWTPSSAIAARVTYAHALKDAPFTGRRDLQDRGFHFSIVVRPLEF